MYINISNSFPACGVGHQLLMFLKKLWCCRCHNLLFAKFPESPAESVWYTDDAVNDVVVELILHRPGHSCHRLTEPHHVHIVV